MITLTEIEALYFDAKALREPLYKLKRVDGGNIRYYAETDPRTGRLAYYPSWTSVFDKVLPMEDGLLRWYCDLGYDKAVERRDKRADYGTTLHIHAANFLINQELDLDNIADDDIQKDLLAWAQFVNEHEVKPIAIEVTLLSRIFGVAGTIDLVCEMLWKGKKVFALVDLKSGRNGFHESHELQLHGYRLMWNENFPEHIIDRVFNWSPKAWEKAPTYTLKDQTESPAAGKIPHLVEIFKMSGFAAPRPSLVISGKIRAGINTEGYYKFISPDELLKSDNGGDFYEMPEEKLIDKFDF
jgi:hypothetical protein